VDFCRRSVAPFVFALVALASVPAMAQDAAIGNAHHTQPDGSFAGEPKPAPAEEAAEEKPLEYKINELTVRPTLSVDTGIFANGNAWFGNADANIGDDSDVWYEGDVKGGFEIETPFVNGTRLTGALNAIYAGQTGDIDAGGSTFPDETQGDILLEDAYLRVDSGNTLPQLGEGALYLSAGRQQFKIGNGLLVKSGSSNGKDRGAYWLGPRKAFDMAVIAGLDTEKIKAQAFYLAPDDNPNTDTETVGVNGDWEPIEKTKLGVAYMNFLDGAVERDGLDVYDLRASSYPFATTRSDWLADWAIGGEYVFERNDEALDADGGWVGTLYSFSKVKWTPSIAYRYAWFEGDDPDTADNEAFDPLFYGSTDWGSWYQGEILGEYALSNSNLESHAVRLRAHPSEALTLTGIVYSFNIPEEASFGVTDSHYADEADLLVDWTITDRLTLSGMVGVAVPGDGAEEATGGDDNWTQGLVSLSWSL
jgi:hypothetical protein